VGRKTCTRDRMAISTIFMSQHRRKRGQALNNYKEPGGVGRVERMQWDRRAEGFTPSADRSLNMPLPAGCMPERLSTLGHQSCVLLHATTRSLTCLLACSAEESLISMLACPSRRTTGWAASVSVSLNKALITQIRHDGVRRTRSYLFASTTIEQFLMRGSSSIRCTTLRVQDYIRT
jgi:hypothetical protein